MKRKALVTSCHVIAVLSTITVALPHRAMSQYHVEVGDAPEANTFQINLWAEGPAIGSAVRTAAAQVEFSNFTGSIDAASLDVESLTPLADFTFAVESGNDFSVPIGFAVAIFDTSGIDLPETAISASTAWPVLKVAYSSTGTGTFDVVVLEPSSSAGTVVNGDPAITRGSMGVATTPNAVPEPSSFVLLLGGLSCGYVYLRRR